MMKALFFIILILLFGCNSPQNRIEKEYPVCSSLKCNIIHSSERLLKDENYYIIQVNSLDDAEHYEPYLLFYKKEDLKLEFSVYNPGKIFSIKDSIITGYYNKFRSNKVKCVLKNGYKFSFEKKEPSNIINKESENLNFIGILKDTLIFKHNESKLEIKYHINEIVYPLFNKNKIQVYDFIDSTIIYKNYFVNQSTLKSEMCNNIR